MAADNRNFADVLDIQGTEVCLSDKKLAETSSETGVQTTDYVLLQDTDGAYHKILKSNFTEAIRNTLAGLLVNNDKGTSVNQIPAIASGDLGSVTPANLASVLGVDRVKAVYRNTTSSSIYLKVGQIEGAINSFMFSVGSGLGNNGTYIASINVSSNSIHECYISKLLGTLDVNVYYKKETSQDIFSIAISVPGWAHIKQLAGTFSFDFEVLSGIDGYTQISFS